MLGLKWVPGVLAADVELPVRFPGVPFGFAGLLLSSFVITCPGRRLVTECKALPVLARLRFVELVRLR